MPVRLQLRALVRIKLTEPLSEPFAPHLSTRTSYAPTLPLGVNQAKSRFNILLNILQPPYIAAMFLRAVFSMFALQMIF